MDGDYITEQIHLRTPQKHQTNMYLVLQNFLTTD